MAKKLSRSERAALKKQKDLEANIQKAESVVAKATNKKEEPQKTVAKAEQKSPSKRSERIKFTTVISPQHRAALDVIAQKEKKSMADLLDSILAQSLDIAGLLENEEDKMAYNFYKKRYSK